MNKKAKLAPVRHHPLTVTLHWLIALIVLAEALIGVGILHFWPNTLAKVTSLTIHMLLGILLLILITAQIAIRFVTPRPTPYRLGELLPLS